MSNMSNTSPIPVENQYPDPEANQNSELISTVDEQGKVLGAVPLVPLLRGMEAHHLDKGEPLDVGVPVIHVWLARSEGADTDPVFIMQERTDNHKLDKTVGGHVSAGISADQAAINETVEEMSGVPLHLIESLGGATLADLKEIDIDLQSHAAAHHAGVDPWQRSRHISRDGNEYHKRAKTHTYIGFFNGPLKEIAANDEVSVFVEKPYSEIKAEIAEDPSRYDLNVLDLIDTVAQQMMRSAQTSEPSR